MRLKYGNYEYAGVAPVNVTTEEYEHGAITSIQFQTQETSVAKLARVLIRDGFTREDKCGPESGWDEVTFTYRPAIPERVSEYTKADRSTPALQTKEAVRIISEHLLSWNVAEWDAAENADKPAPLNPDTLRVLPPPILAYILDAVTGYGTARPVRELVKN